jgi:hypothetical protein
LVCGYARAQRGFLRPPQNNRQKAPNIFQEPGTGRGKITRENCMTVEIVTHCYRYSTMLRFQLSSLVSFICSKVRIVATICFTESDNSTVAVLDEFKGLTIPNLEWNWVPLPILHLCRRSIGRNIVALSTNADWVWFCDADYWFGAQCWMTFAHFNELEHPLIYPRYVRMPPLRWGDRCIETAQGLKGPLILPETEFRPVRMNRAIGGIQIVKGRICRERGYLRADRRWQRRASAPIFQESFEDLAFRRDLGTSGKAVDIPEVYRIRHSRKGWKDGSVTL